MGFIALLTKLFSNQRGTLRTATRTRTQVSTRTKVLVTLGVVGVVAAAAFGYAFAPGIAPVRIAPLPLVTRPVTAVESGSASRSTGFTLRLSDWWTGAPASVVTNYDPVGAQIQAFWLDADGTVCHGTPGVDGQPGAKTLEPTRFRATVSDGLRRDPPVTMAASALAGAQSDLLPTGSYVANGAHLLIAQAAVWRVQSGGALVTDGTTQPSQFMDASFGDTLLTPGTLRAKSLFNATYPCLAPDRGRLPIGVPLTGLGPSAPQHPTECRTRQTITAAQLLTACATGRLTGSLADGFLRIRP